MTEQKTKRAATRYPYVADAQCVKDDKVFSCKLQDISTSGIQIVIDQVFEQDQQISLMWEDPNEGEIEGVFYIMRKFEKTDSHGKHYYGVRYYQLDQIAKQRVLNVLNTLKNVQKKESEKISLDAIYECVDQGSAYIKENISNLANLHPFFSKPLEALQPYEKEAFEGESDPYKDVIIDFVTNHFHCVILKNVVPFALKKTTRIPGLLSRVVRVLELTEENEKKEEAIFEYVKDLDNSMEMKMHYNESTNRVFYGKQAMMEKVVKSLESFELLPELKEQLNYISTRYDHTIELTNPNIGLEDIHTVSKHPPKKDKKKDKDKSNDGGKFNKKDSQFYVPSLESKGTGKKIFLGLVIVAIAASFVVKKYSEVKETNKYKATLRLPIEISEASRDGSQLYIYFLPEEWAKLDERKTQQMRTYLQGYLLEDKWLRTALLRTTKADVKMIITTLQ